MPVTKSDVIGSIRRQLIRGPHQRGFDAGVWSKALSSAGAEDELLRASGLVFNEMMSGLRGEAEHLLRRYSDPRDGIFHVVTRANIYAVRIQKLMGAPQKASEREAFDSSDIVSSVVELDDGSIESPDEMMLGLIDSVVYPIQAYLKAKPDDQISVEDATVDWMRIFSNANGYCLAYHFCQKAIYERKYARLIDEAWVVEAIDAHQARLFAVSDFFGQERDAERAMTLRFSGPNQFPPSARLALLPKRGIDRLVTRGKYWTVRTLSRRNSGNHKIPDAMMVAMATTSPGSVSLLDRTIDAVAPGTLRDLVKAWVLLSEIADKWIGVRARRSEPEFLRVTDGALFSRKAIETLFRESIPTSETVASAICDFLTFDGKRHDDLWSHPLIPFGDDSRALFVPSLVIPNTGRVIDSWIETTEVVAQARGSAFEHAVRSRVCQTLNASVAKSVSVCCPEAIVLPAGQGEVDLLAVVDGTILAAELKCRKQPADPAERHYFRVSIRQAVNQILRARLFLYNHREFVSERFASLLQQESLLNLEVAPILPVVITNQYYGSGVSYCGVPVFQFEYFLEQLGHKRFRKILNQLAREEYSANTPYPENMDAILSEDAKALPLPEYDDVSSRVIPHSKKFRLTYRDTQFEERHFRTRSRYEAGTFLSAPGTAFRIN